MNLLLLSLFVGASTALYTEKDDVVVLTDDNFESNVLNSKDIWMVKFYAPWGGHCKHYAPHWKAAATELKGKVKLGALDATVHTVAANKFGIRGFPTIKYFAPGSDASDAVDYKGGRLTEDIVRWASEKFEKDGKDGDITVEEEIDLSDVDLDHNEL